jgi:hypothetical protein
MIAVELHGFRAKQVRTMLLRNVVLPDGMAKRLKEAAAKDGIVFRQHRFRSTRAQPLDAAGVPDSSVIEMLGWGVESGSRMLHRYVGRVPLSTLKSYPPILDRVLGPVA